MTCISRFPTSAEFLWSIARTTIIVCSWAKMTATKRKATDELAAGAVAAAVENVVFVVTYHYHCDDYKRADSEAGIVGVYDTEVDALKKCIVGNITENKYQEVTSIELQNLLGKAYPDHEVVKRGHGGPFSVFSKREIKDTISELSLAELTTIDSELNDSIAEIEPQYTMKPSMTTFSVHKEVVVSKDHASDDEED